MSLEGRIYLMTAQPEAEFSQQDTLLTLSLLVRGMNQRLRDSGRHTDHFSLHTHFKKSSKNASIHIL